MNKNSLSSSNDFQKKKIGEILQQAGLISSAQLKVALTDQNQFCKLKIGEILVLRGWLKPQTIDFLVSVFLDQKAIDYNQQYPIGQYFRQAGLLTEEQINILVKQQKLLGIKFCQLAVMKGFLHQETVDFFLDNIMNGLSNNKNQTVILDEFDTLNEVNVKTVVSDYTLYEFVKDKETIVSQNNLDNQLSPEETFINDSEIQYSPIWIDV